MSRPIQIARDVALRFVEAVLAQDPHAISRGLELAEAVADLLELEDELPAEADVLRRGT